MNNLKDILYGVNLIEVIGPTDRTIRGIHFDSREVKKNSIFVAVRGTVTDGHEYIDQAIEKGAAAIIVEEMPAKLTKSATFIKVQSSTKAMGAIASNFFDNPSERLSLVGITGTNGKSTTATLLFDLFLKLGYKVGLISTIQYQVHDRIIPMTHTTPSATKINELLSMMVDEGCEFCFMEVSSHAIDQGRIEGLTFAGGVFTNISHDHLDYHKSFKEYIQVKKRFFDELGKSAFALVNMDDKQGGVMLQNTNAKKYSYALKTMADYKGKVLESSLTGLMVFIDGEELYSPLVGHFNASNILAVYSVANLLKQDKLQTLTIISGLKNVEGRFENITSEKDQIVGIIDYAHSPDALKNVLDTIKKLRTGEEKVITVVGCGGDRDKAKRPIMARIACELSDHVVLTTDNPRTEKAETIISDMQAGIPNHLSGKVLMIGDRKEAIKTACTLADSGDIILVAGKGHEKYQEIKGKKYPFDDKLVLKETFKEMAK